MTMLPSRTVTTDDKMSIDERYQYQRRMQKPYRHAPRQDRKALLDGIVALQGCTASRSSAA